LNIHEQIDQVFRLLQKVQEQQKLTIRLVGLMNTYVVVTHGEYRGMQGIVCGPVDDFFATEELYVNCIDYDQFVRVPVEFVKLLAKDE
jgi:hypothetical protein